MNIKVSFYDKKDIESNLNDIMRIRKVLNEHGIDIYNYDCVRLWRFYSHKYSAAWLILPQNDNDLYDILIKELLQ